MIQLLHKRKRVGDGEITFPELQCWNPVTEVVTFVAELNGERIDCKIKLSDLNKRYPTASDDPMTSINIYKKALESIAKFKIEENRFENNGAIHISFNDME